MGDFSSKKPKPAWVQATKVAMTDKTGRSPTEGRVPRMVKSLDVSTDSTRSEKSRTLPTNQAKNRTPGAPPGFSGM